MNSKHLSLLAWVVLTGCGEQLVTTKPSPGVAGKNTAALTCPTSPAPDLMTMAVCACGNLEGVGQGITTHASAAGQTANIGINGTANVVGTWNVEGTLRAHDGISGVGELTVRDDALTYGNFDGVGQANIGRTLAVRGNLSSVGDLTVGGALKIGGTIDSVGGATLTPQAFDLGDGMPCNCDGLNVAAEVTKGAAHPQTQQLGAVDTTGDGNLTFTTGSYYLPSFRATGTMNITIDGAVALYVGGDFNLVGDGALNVPPGSTLDLYVAGNVETVGTTLFKSAPTPGAVRWYVHGGYSAVGEQTLPLSIYAPNANLDFVGGTTIQGSVLAHSISSTGGLDVTYAGPSAPAQGTCTNDPLPGGSTDADAGTGVIGIY